MIPGELLEARGRVLFYCCSDLLDLLLGPHCAGSTGLGLVGGGPQGVVLLFHAVNGAPVDAEPLCDLGDAVTSLQAHNDIFTGVGQDEIVQK